MNIFRLFIKMALVLAPFSLLAQDKASTTSTYITPYAGVMMQGTANTEQTGTAHLRGNYNYFRTDFDLKVRVTGESESTTGNTYGFTYGNIWKKDGRKINLGFEIDFFQNSSSHSSKLSNPNTQVAANIVGQNQDSVLSLVNAAFAAGQHRFENSMTMNSLNAATNLIFSYDVSTDISINGGLGVGFSAITMKDAKSFQSNPASANASYEMTTENGGGIVNHYNSQSIATDNVMFTQFRIGSKYQVVQNVGIRFDVRAMSVGESTFNFGSTKYLDHAPTDNWMYMIGQNTAYTITLGLCVNM